MRPCGVDQWQAEVYMKAGQIKASALAVLGVVTCSLHHGQLLLSQELSIRVSVLVSQIIVTCY